MVPWQIREFPERLRDAITEQARKENVKVGELLTRLVIEANDAGWSFKNPTSDRYANPSNPSDASGLRAFTDLLTSMAAAGIEPQARVGNAANGVAMQAARALLQQRKVNLPGQPAITAPTGSETDAVKAKDLRPRV